MVNLALKPGVTVAGRYRLEMLLGEGGVGVVWSAHDISLNREVALKVLKPDLSLQGHVRQRFLREARAAYAIRHANVVRVHDVAEAGEGNLVIVMERLQGETLAAKLLRDKRIDLPELSEIMLQVLAAVKAAHDTHVVHRDLKPENIFLCAGPPPGENVRVLDFGLAKLLNEEGSKSAGLTGTGAMLGTPYYMSPEQVFGERSLDQRTDIWSLGVILYECLSGTRPTEAGNVGQIFKCITRGNIVPLHELEPSLPVSIANLVTRMLAIDPASRPATVGEVRDTFAKLGRLGSETASNTERSTHETATLLSALPTGSAWSRSFGPRRERSLQRLRIALGALLALAASGFALKSLSAEPSLASSRARLLKSTALSLVGSRPTRALGLPGPQAAPATDARAALRSANESPVPKPRRPLNERRRARSNAANSGNVEGSVRTKGADDLFADPI